MSNFDRAVKSLNDADVLYGALVSNEDYATVLQGRGLLAPDLPEPEVRHLEEVNTDVLAWKSDHVEVGVCKNWIAMDDPIKSGMTSDESRRLALALLAACEYAEKEQGNE